MTGFLVLIKNKVDRCVSPLKSRGSKDIKYNILTAQTVNCSLVSQTRPDQLSYNFCSFCFPLVDLSIDVEFAFLTQWVLHYKARPWNPIPFDTVLGDNNCNIASFSSACIPSWFTYTNITYKIISWFTYIYFDIISI